MSKLFSSIIFSLFLLFQTTALAEEDTAPTETNIEESPRARSSRRDRTGRAGRYTGSRRC